MKKFLLLLTLSLLPNVICAQSIFDLLDQKNYSAMEKKLSEGDNPNKQNKEGINALFSVSFDGDTTAVKILLKYGADINFESEPNKLTELIAASQNGNVEIAKILIKAGANVNAKDIHGWSALRTGTRNGRIDIIELLVNNNAIIDDKASDGATPMMMAAYKGHQEIVEYLLSKAANINSLAKDKETALQILSVYLRSLE